MTLPVRLPGAVALLAPLTALAVGGPSLSRPTPLPAQALPLAPVVAEGQTVTPAFEGWYRNADGSFTLSFGYFNRNAEEILHLPRGEANAIEPAAFDGGQPERFLPRRHWGVFGVRVPEDFPEDEKVYWTLRVRGETLRVPGHLRAEWEIDALGGEAGSGNTPPVLAFGAVEGSGPAGVTSLDTVRAKVGEAITLAVRARDDGRVDNSVVSAGRPGVPVTLTWLPHQGPGRVRFEPPSSEVAAGGGEATTSATFAEPGSYVVRARANDASGVTGAGHAQCCWSNGFIHVVVVR